MLKETSENFRIFFLREFTRELIKNSETAEAIALKKRLREKIKENIEKKENEERLNKIIEKKAITEELKEISIQENIPIRKKIIPKYQNLRISYPKIPETIRDIKPFPEEMQINLNVLNPLIKDPTVLSIECNGPGKNIIVRRIRGEKRTTNIILKEEEIKGIIEIFSKEAKIPSQEGIFKAAVGKLIISAISSEITGSKFIITKLSPFEMSNYKY
jgi:hypothetical protein